MKKQTTTFFSSFWPGPEVAFPLHLGRGIIFETKELFSQSRCLSSSQSYLFYQFWPVTFPLYMISCQHGSNKMWKCRLDGDRFPCHCEGKKRELNPAGNLQQR